jgi:hypothetical protein
MCGLSEKTVRRWIASGRLPAEKIDGVYSVALADVVELGGGVSATLSAPASAPGTDRVSARSADTDVRTDEGNVRPSERPTALAQADALASLIQATLTPIVAPLVAELAASRQTVERQAQTIAELREERGRLTAELAAGRAKSPPDASTATHAPDLTPEPLPSFPWPVPPSPGGRALAPWLLSVLAIVVAVAVLLAVSAVYG